MNKKNSTVDIKNIIFDLGGVLIDWNPDYVFLKVFKGDKLKLKEFYEKVCTFEWNENQDAGYPLDKATEDIRLATRHLGMLVGKVDVEEILGSIFNDFCIGK